MNAIRLAEACALTAAMVLGMPVRRAQAEAEPVHLVFWQPADIRDGRDVEFGAHVFDEKDRVTLLPADPGRESLWYMPTDVVRGGDDVRVYYQRVEKRLPEYSDQRTFCVGVLRGEKLELPDLKQSPAPWGGPANVVLRRSPHKPTWGGFNVFQMARVDGGFRLLYWDQPARGDAGALLARSADGLRWEKSEEQAVFTEHNDAFTLTHDADGRGFLLYQTRLEDWPDKPFPDNIGGKRRVIALRQSRDLAAWTPQETILRPDEQDAPETEFYLMKVFRVAGRFVGLIMVYYGDPRRPNQHSAILRNELVFSPDGRRWDRPYRYTDVGLWTYADPFEHQRRLCLVAHHERSLSLFRTRPDGLADCGSRSEGRFCTRRFTMPKRPLRLSADCREGSIAVEVLDEEGLGIDGYTGDACAFKDVEGGALPLRWGDRGTGDLAGRTVHLRFVLRRARVFSVREATASS